MRCRQLIIENWFSEVEDDQRNGINKMMKEKAGAMEGKRASQCMKPKRATGPYQEVTRNLGIPGTICGTWISNIKEMQVVCHLMMVICSRKFMFSCHMHVTDSTYTNEDSSATRQCSQVRPPWHVCGHSCLRVTLGLSTVSIQAEEQLTTKKQSSKCKESLLPTRSTTLFSSILRHTAHIQFCLRFSTVLFIFLVIHLWKISVLPSPMIICTLRQIG
jgi:hypothetical protein